MAPPPTGHTDTVYAVAFSPDGKRLAGASHDKTVRVRDIALPPDPLPLLREACGIAIRSFTPQEWQRYIPGVQYRSSCPAR